MHTHLFQLNIIWTGNNGTGTSAYDAYSRNHTIRCEGKADLQASSDPYFRGEKEKYNPEDLLLASISSCHMLWYLHLCADAGIVVVNYEDKPQGTMITGAEVRGKFTEVVLHPHVTITDASRVDEANALHHKAHEKCFISNSCNFPILCEGKCEVDK
jgi:organic hydroperoxide reductase OsmC/OhrA